MKKLLYSILCVAGIVGTCIITEGALKERARRNADPLGEAYTISILDDHTILFTSEESKDSFRMSVENAYALEENSRIFIKR